MTLAPLRPEPTECVSALVFAIVWTEADGRDDEEPITKVERPQRKDDR